MDELYKNIKKYRIARQMSQDDLAKKAGYKNRSAITLIEKGAVDLPQSKIVAIAKALRVPPGALMGSVYYFIEPDGTEHQITKYDYLIGSINSYCMEFDMEQLEEIEKRCREIDLLRKLKEQSEEV